MSEEPTNTLEPDTRRIGNDAPGTPVEINGQTWFLATGIPRLGPVWDRLYDANTLAGGYERGDVKLAALRLLEANYVLTTEEAVGLISRADLEDLVLAVESALFVPDKVHRTYSEWVQVSFRINGIDLASTPPALINHIMEVLVEMQKTLPANEFISSIQAAAVFDQWRKMIKRPAATAEPVAEN